MIFILRGKLNSFRFVHSAKASDSISFTLSGISMCVSILHPSNADGAIDSTSFGIIVFAQPLIRLLFFLRIIALQLFLESYIGFFSSTVIDLSATHPIKWFPQISTKLAGMFIDFKLVRFSNANIPSDFMPSGIFVSPPPTSKRLSFVRIIALQFSRESKIGLALSTDIDMSELHLIKASSCSSITLAGINMD